MDVSNHPKPFRYQHSQPKLFPLTARRSAIAVATPLARDEFARAVSVCLDRFGDQVALAIVNAIMSQIEAAFRDWYRQGGTLNAVEENVADI
jgi:hypothetical protein